MRFWARGPRIPWLLDPWWLNLSFRPYCSRLRRRCPQSRWKCHLCGDTAYAVAQQRLAALGIGTSKSYKIHEFNLSSWVRASLSSQNTRTCHQQQRLEADSADRGSHRQRSRKDFLLPCCRRNSSPEFVFINFLNLYLPPQQEDPMKHET